jgi:hypothetical protein
MAVNIVSGKGCVFSVWGKPKKSDMDLIEKELREAALVSGGPVTYITRVPVDAPAPDPDVRRHLDSLMPKIVESCSTYHVVLEGKGFVAAVKRAVLNSLFQIRWKRGVFFVHASATEVAHAVPSARMAEVKAVIERARVVGLLTADAISSVPPPAASARNANPHGARASL